MLFSSGVALPSNVPPVRRRASTGAGLGASGHWSSNQTVLDWSWLAEGSGVRSHRGTLTWPADHNRAGYDHAVKLLQVAEASISLDCSGETLPAWVLRELLQAGPVPLSRNAVQGLFEPEGCEESGSNP